MSVIQRMWYQSSPINWLIKWLFLPLTALFWLISCCRRMAYNFGWLTSIKVSSPVIIVGNISVGGNGKTPVVMLIANWLQEQGYKPGILSRGYGGKSPIYPLTVDSQSDPREVGDEPVLLTQRLNCPVVIDPKRARGAQYLLDEHQCDLVLCDDGLQHYALQRDIEIVVIDGERRHGNGWLLPMGPLRETSSRLDNVDFVINNGGPAQSNEHLMEVSVNHLVNVAEPAKTCTVGSWNKPVVATAAIGNPSRFFALLDKLGFNVTARLPFIDHHQYKASDLPHDCVLMTEKDAVKCRSFAKADWWFLPIDAQLPESFLQQLKNKLQSLKSSTKDNNDNGI